MGVFGLGFIMQTKGMDGTISEVQYHTIPSRDSIFLCVMFLATKIVIKMRTFIKGEIEHKIKNNEDIKNNNKYFYKR